MNLETFALNHNQILDAIMALGDQRTILIEGHMGTGKTALLDLLAERLPEHVPMYFDCTNKDVGDISIPKMLNAEDVDFVRFAPNEEFGIQHGKPVLLMLDEFGKANRAVKAALTRVVLERKVGQYPLPEGSIVFATTNLAGEGVGDELLAHQSDRVTRIRMRKPTATEWIEWGINNHVHPTVLGWVKENPHVLQSYEDVTSPEDNPYIFHPREKRVAFVTPRSLAMASDWLHKREQLDDDTLTAMLIGTVGMRAALDMNAFIKLADQLPKMQDIKDSPETAPVPTSAAAICMVVYRTLATIEADWVNAWMTYLNRLDPEAQGLFANGVRAPKYKKQSVVMTNKQFSAWAMNNSHMFTADKV